MRQRFVAGVGGTLRYVPPEARLFGAPTAATVSLRNARGIDLPTPVKDATAVVDPVHTTLSGAAAEGDAKLALVSVASIVPGRRYLVSASDGERFEVEVAGVDATNKAVLLFDKLPRDLVQGDAFDGIEVTYALAGAQCPDPLTAGGAASLYLGVSITQEEGSWTPLYTAVWAVTIGGIVYPGDQLYEVRKRLLASTLTLAEVERALPAPWADLSDLGPRALYHELGDSWDDVLDDLQKKGYEPDKIKDPDRLRQPHRERVLAKLARTWGKEWADWSKEQQAIYMQALEDALNSGTWYDRAEDNIKAPGEVKWPAVSMSR